SASASADANVETLQAIVVKPPWIDSMANGGRLFHQCLNKIRLPPIKLPKSRIG
ncbi:hypothetical protein ACTXT7_016585, partial [Hymenolepis weldensis]